jgi:hypothetical protein
MVRAEEVEPMTTKNTTSMSAAEMAAELLRLRAENQALKETAPKGLPMKATEKGAVSVYGLGRFPTTLYPQQWEKLLDQADEIRAFIGTNRASLSWKDEEKS